MRESFTVNMELPDLTDEQAKILAERDAYLDTADFSFLTQIDGQYPCTMEAAQYYCLKEKRLLLFTNGKRPWAKMIPTKWNPRSYQNLWLRHLQAKNVNIGYEASALFSFKDFEDLIDDYKKDFGSKESTTPGIALLMGAANRLLCIDCDGSAGIENFHTLWKTYTGQDEPETVSELTPGGGQHYLFRVGKDCTLGNSRGGLPPSVDVRGNGGYIVISPTKRIVDGEEKRYTPVFGKTVTASTTAGEIEIKKQYDLLDLPFWLQNLLEENTKKKIQMKTAA